MLDLDVLPERRFELRKVLGNRIFQRQLPFFGKLQDGHGRELLGNRGDVEERVAVDRHLGIDVGDAVALVEDDVVALHYEDGCPRLVGGEQRGAELV